MTGLTIEGVHKTFFPGTVNEIKALKGIDLTLAPGEFVTVVGSNGAGKSTLLNSVAGVITPDRGRILLGGTDVTRLSEVQRAARIGRVLQNPLAGTAPSLTVAENLSLALARGRSRGLRWALTAAKRRMFAEELAQLGLGLENRLNDKVGLLSGGQRQALSLLMATLQRPDVLLLDGRADRGPDEPLGAAAPPDHPDDHPQPGAGYPPRRPAGHDARGAHPLHRNRLREAGADHRRAPPGLRARSGPGVHL